MDERARRMDRRRVDDLERIVSATDLYWTRHSLLPASLDELTAEPGVSIDTRDPAGSENYGYQPVDSTHYEVCANFESESEKVAWGQEKKLLAHGTGRQCFQFEAKELKR